MNPALVECVPNLSEGRDPAALAAFRSAIEGVAGVTLLHQTSDADHNRSVFTFAGAPESVQEAAVRLAAEAVRRIHLPTHRGVHPRVGALDVLPFVPLRGATLSQCAALAHETGQRLWQELALPVYFYEAAALRPERKRLEAIRRGQFEGLLEAAPLDPARAPDVGGPALHPTAGAVVVGARPILIAYNINLRTGDLTLARSIAAAIRESNGGLPGVKALGLPLATRGLVQVSMNLTDHQRTPVHTVYRAVEQLAQAAGVDIEESELIGLMPRAAVEAAASSFLKLTGFHTEQVIENQLEAAPAASEKTPQHLPS